MGFLTLEIPPSIVVMLEDPIIKTIVAVVQTLIIHD